MAYTDEFDKVVDGLFRISKYMDEHNLKVMFVCKQGRDRSVLMARLLMEFRGMDRSEVCADKFLLTW